MTITELHLNFARTLADPNFSLSVPRIAKEVIRDLLEEVERQEPTIDQRIAQLGGALALIFLNDEIGARAREITKGLPMPEPVPSKVATADQTALTAEIREAYVRPTGLFGHYGAEPRARRFDDWFAVTRQSAGEPTTGTVPTIWIQWKGTEACFDFWCGCVGEDQSMGHADTKSGVYAIECERCGRKYDMPQTLPLLPFSGKWEPIKIGGFDA